MTAHLLKIANSPLYGFTSRIDTISRAVMVIGTRGLRDLALATSAVDVFSKIPRHHDQHGQFLAAQHLYRA